MAVTMGTALMGGGALLSAFTGYRQSKARQTEAGFDKAVADLNVQIAKDDIKAIGQQGDEAIYAQRRQTARDLSSLRAATAASGFTVDDRGTTQQDMVYDMRVAGELDVMRLKTNIQREQRKTQIRALNATLAGEGAEFRSSSENPFMSGLISGASSALSSGLAADLLP